MDDLYDNLDNYNEENTIAELQTENKELKSQLEEYSIAMSKLQEDFDKLSSEYTRLELNYSSLLKTAKAEIERKTQIITNLNLEKDRMVLKSYQNKNSSNLYKSRQHGSPTVQQKCDKDKNELVKCDDKLQQFDGRKSSPYSSIKRTEKKEPSPKVTTASPQTDLASKLFNMAHGSQINDSRTDKNSDVKENIMQPKKESDALKVRASIKDRRKSMPAISMETELQLSDEDVDIGSNGSSKTLQQTNTENNFSEKYVDHNFCERPTSGISESSSLEEKKNSHEPIPDNTKQRFSRYDRDKDDKYRVRHKSSHRYKRSPDRYHSGPREYYDPYHKSEHDRYRSKGKISGSPPRDAYHHRSSRDLHRSNYVRSHPYEHERLLPRNQERYAMKRRIELGYDEFENKRHRMESHSKQLEEDRRMELDYKRHKIEYSRHHEEDRRNKDERKPINKKYIDPLEIQFSSCESPDYDFPDVGNQQVREIKLTATTKLDDPRISSKKYVLKKNDDQVILTTVSGRNVDLVPVKKNEWGIKPINVPEALVKRPPEYKRSSKDICKEIDNPANISIESGEILDDINIQNRHHKPNVVNFPRSEIKEMPVLMTQPEEYKDVEDSLKNIHSYKIPKARKSVDENQSSKDTKKIISTVKPYDNTSSKNDVSKDPDIDINESKVQVELVDEKQESEGHKQDSFIIKNKVHLSCHDSSISNVYEQRHPTTKGVVENDLQMSDDNCDEQSEHVTKGSDLCTELENKTLGEEESCNTITERHSTDVTMKATSERCKDKSSTGDTKKSKSKKKSKHKEPKDVSKTEDSAKVLEKPTKKKEKAKENKIQIKTKFSELFDDSSSLILPEDLGLSSVSPPTTLHPNKCVPFFEDALDADDLNRIKSDATKDSIPSQNMDVENKPHNDVTVTKMDTIYPVSLDDSLDKSDDRYNGVQTELTDDVIKSIYQNLEPGNPEEENIVKTVIISTGVQPPVLFKDEKQLPSNKDQLQPKNMQDLGLQALATSTPHKISQPDKVVADTESKLPLLDSTSINSSQIASVGDTATLDKSDSNTVDSHISDANVPDVRIFVKRRRKVTKKET